MATLEYNEATKKVSFSEESLAGLSKSEQEQANTAAELVNKLMGDLKDFDGEFPPPPGKPSEKITVAASKLAQNGVKALQQKKPEEAVKLLSTALEVALRRPLWEPAVILVEELSSILSARADAYMLSGQVADAYADASLLLLLKSQEPLNYCRKASILYRIGRVSDAKELLQTGLGVAPGNEAIKSVLRSIDQNPK